MSVVRYMYSRLTKLGLSRPVHPPHSSVIQPRIRKYGFVNFGYGNAHHLNIFSTVISSCACVKNVAPSVGNVHVPHYYARCQATRNIP